MNVNGLKAAPAPKRAPVLAGLKRTRLDVPMRVLIYGEAGIGKSTFASRAPSPIFLGAEDGTSELEVVRYPFRARVTWEALLEAIDVLTEEEHEYQTVVIDSIDWAEPLAWATACREANKPSIEAIGYSKGYVRAQELWLQLLRRLDALRAARRMHVILVGHAVIRTFHNPEGDDYDNFALKLHEKSAGVVREWCDAVLFARLVKFTHKADGARAKAVSTGARVLETEANAAYFAKNRYSLPSQLPLEWDDFANAIRAGRPEETLTRVRALLAELETLGAVDLVARARPVIERDANDTAKLLVHINRLTVRLEEAKKGTP